MIKVEMHFLPDIYVSCDVCSGGKYNRETLSIKYKGKNIKEVLDLTVSEALDFFENIPSIRDKLSTLQQVGLSYIHGVWYWHPDSLTIQDNWTGTH